MASVVTAPRLQKHEGTPKFGHLNNRSQYGKSFWPNTLNNRTAAYIYVYGQPMDYCKLSSVIAWAQYDTRVFKYCFSIWKSNQCDRGANICAVVLIRTHKTSNRGYFL